jgi:hypothetical protein
LVSDLGELVCVDRLDEAIPVPFGEYQLSSLRLDVSDSSGKSWTYSFYGERTRNYSVPANGEIVIRILSQLKMDIAVPMEKPAASPGQTISIQPKLLADGSLYLSRCTVGNDADGQQMEGSTEILLLGTDGKTVIRGVTGFS